MKKFISCHPIQTCTNWLMSKICKCSSRVPWQSMNGSKILTRARLIRRRDCITQWCGGALTMSWNSSSQSMTFSKIQPFMKQVVQEIGLMFYKWAHSPQKKPAKKFTICCLTATHASKARCLTMFSMQMITQWMCQSTFNWIIMRRSKEKDHNKCWIGVVIVK